MNYSLITTTLNGLIATAKEKKCVLGKDAKEDLKKIKEIYEELVMFWDLDERLIKQYEIEVGEIEID